LVGDNRFSFLEHLENDKFNHNPKLSSKYHILKTSQTQKTYDISTTVSSQKGYIPLSNHKVLILCSQPNRSSSPLLPVDGLAGAAEPDAAGAPYSPAWVFCLAMSAIVRPLLPALADFFGPASKLAKASPPAPPVRAAGLPGPEERPLKAVLAPGVVAALLAAGAGTEV
jgi:hypothetical protein